MFNYYYNNVPGIGLTRNNLIYTSLISSDKKTFIQWYYNDTEYHADQNEVVNSDKMEEKFKILCNDVERIINFNAKYIYYYFFLSTDQWLRWQHHQSL